MKIKRVYADECPMNPCGQGGIEFDNGNVLIDFHDQDCCEHVYANFVSLDHEAMSYNFKTIRIERARKGFRFGDGRRWFYIPCYNEQNGYYNDALQIVYGQTAKKIARYQKGRPVYTFKLLPITALNDCPVEDDII